MSGTVIIGGGIAGLATAALLAREGHTVQLLERGGRVGGRAGMIERAGFRFDTGPSWYLMPRVFDHFFDLLGTTTAAQLDLRGLDPGYRVFREPAAGDAATVIDIPAGAARVRDVFEARETGGAHALTRYLGSAERAARLAEDRFLYNPFTSWRSLAAREVLAAAPALASGLGMSLHRFVARRFADPLLRQVLEYPAVFLGTDPRRAPALYHLMSTLDLSEGVQYPMGGFWGLVETLERLARAEGVTIRTGVEVTRILTVPSGRRHRTVGVRVRTAGGEETIPAETVVSAADLHHTETALLPASARTYPERWWRRRRSGPGAVIALLGIRGRTPQLAHHSLLFTRDWDANFDALFGGGSAIPDPTSLYVCRPTATEPGVAPDGHENLFVLIPVPADIDIGSGGPEGTGSPAVERAVDAAIAQVADWAGIPDLADRVVVRESLGPADFARDYHSWRGGMLGPAHILSQSAMFRAQNQSRRVDGLYYAGATTAPGVGVPMCLISAELVLKRVRGDRSAGPLR